MDKTVAELAERSARRYQLALRERQERQLQRPARVITISRMFGAGGISVSRLLGEKLGCPVWDREILEVLASESQGKYQSQMFESLDERSQGVIESFLSSVAGRVGKDTYLYLLQRAMLIVSRSDGIVLGRAANLLLPNALKVFLKASLPTRVENVMKLLQMNEKQARQEIARREGERRQFLEEVRAKFGDKTNSGLDFDLEMNTDTIDFETAVDLIQTAADKKFTA